MKSNLFVRIAVLFVLACAVCAVAQDSPMNNNITGSGTKGTVPIFTGPHKIGNSLITTDSAGDVFLGQNLTVSENIAATGWVASDNYLYTTGVVYSTESDTQGGPTYSGLGVFDVSAGQAVIAETGNGAQAVQGQQF